MVGLISAGILASGLMGLGHMGLLEGIKLRGLFGFIVCKDHYLCFIGFTL